MRDIHLLQLPEIVEPKRSFFNHFMASVTITIFILLGWLYFDPLFDDRIAELSKNTPIQRILVIGGFRGIIIMFINSMLMYSYKISTLKKFLVALTESIIFMLFFVVSDFDWIYNELVVNGKFFTLPWICTTRTILIFGFFLLFYKDKEA